MRARVPVPASTTRLIIMIHIAQRALFDDALSGSRARQLHIVSLALARRMRATPCGFDAIAFGRHRAIGLGHFQQRHFLRAERQRVIIVQRRAHAEPAGDVDHVVAADFIGDADRHHVERIGEGAS